MSTVVSAEEAQEQWLELLDRVARGERIAIAKGGRPVAALVPPESQPRDVREVIAEFRAFSAGRSLGGLSIRELIEQGRRRLKLINTAEGIDSDGRGYGDRVSPLSA